MYDILKLNKMLVPELRELADKLDMKGYKRLTKKELIAKIVDNQKTDSKADMPLNVEPEKKAPKREQSRHFGQ